ncbi:MAG: imidazole glycerol phosphate synthase subunit HisH [Alphaproteobacteria bacterium]|nr:imidazole glycerol phosphate synthase subunit HisH [Alphaproteobacteria bacterium]
MTVDVTVVDYGIGNLFSVRRALETCGASVAVTDDRKIIESSPRLVLPGVGAFADGMRGLIERKLDRVVVDYAKSNRPLLGICLGMQMLATVSEEFGEHKGLDLIPGCVKAVEPTGADGVPHKIPHIGWTELQMPRSRNSWDDTILADLQPGSSVYLVHSFAVVPDDETNRLADCDYSGRTISAAIQNGNVYGCQFHPEKSGRVGLTILSRFLS